MHAQLAGVDESLLVTRSGIGAKIAALLPFPLLRWPWAGRHARAAVGRGRQPIPMRCRRCIGRPSRLRRPRWAGPPWPPRCWRSPAPGRWSLPTCHGVRASRQRGTPSRPRSRGIAPRRARSAAAIAAAPVHRAGSHARLQVAGSAQKAGQAAFGTSHHAGARVAAQPARPAVARLRRQDRAPATGAGAAASVMPVSRCRGDGASAGTVVRSAGGSLADTLGAATHTVTSLTGARPSRARCPASGIRSPG